MTCITAMSLSIAQIDMTDRQGLLSLGRNLSPLDIASLSGRARAVADQATSVYRYEAGKQSPAKTWANAPISHKAVFKALRVDPSEPCAFYACFPFRLAMMGERARILMPVAIPKIANGEVVNHIDIDQVLAWNPVANTVEVMGDTNPQAIMPEIIGDQVNIYGDPFLFFRSIVEKRAAFWQMHTDAIAQKWKHPAPETSWEGILAVGNIDAIRWPVHRLPAVISAIGIDRAKLNSSIFRSAQLPRVVDKNPILRAAA